VTQEELDEPSNSILCRVSIRSAMAAVLALAIGFLPPESHDQLAPSQENANRKKRDKLRERAWTQLKR